MGNFCYASDDILKYFIVEKKSASICDTFPTILRNLSLVYYNKKIEKINLEVAGESILA